MKPMTKTALHSQIDELIDWYEKFKPTAGMRIMVDCVASDLLLMPSDRHPPPLFIDGKILYRDRELVPIKRPTNKRKAQPASQDQIEAARLLSEQ